MKSVDLLCASKLKSMVGPSAKIKKKKIDISRLPPPYRCLKQHIRRVNLRAYRLKRSHRQYVELPPAPDHAWRKVGDDLIPDWCDGPTISESLDKLIRSAQESQNKSLFM